MRRCSCVPSGRSTTSEKTITPPPGAERTSLWRQLGLVVGEDHADRLVAAAVAAEPLERGGDRLLDASRAPSFSASSRPRSEDVVADVALGQAQAQHVLGRRARARRAGDDAGVDAAGDADDDPAAAERGDGLPGAHGQPLDDLRQLIGAEPERVGSGVGRHRARPYREPPSVPCGS